MPMIDFACERCQQPYRVDEAHAGRRLRCKRCGELATVPRPTSPSAFDPYGLHEETPAPSKPTDTNGVIPDQIRRAGTSDDAEPELAPSRTGPARLRRKRDPKENHPWLGVPGWVALPGLFLGVIGVNVLDLVVRAGGSGLSGSLLGKYALGLLIVSLPLQLLNGLALQQACNFCGEETPAYPRALGLTLMIALAAGAGAMVLALLGLNYLGTGLVTYLVAAGLILTRALRLSFLSVLVVSFVQLVIYLVLIFGLLSLVFDLIN